MNAGRPTKLTPDIQRKICEAIKAGNYIETAAAYTGLHQSTVRDWIKRGEREIQRIEQAGNRASVRKKERIYVEFSESVKKALAESEIRDVTLIGQAAKENWQAAAWRLERKFPERWGRKDKVKSEVEHSGKIDYENVSPKEKLKDKLQTMKGNNHEEDD